MIGGNAMLQGGVQMWSGHKRDHYPGVLPAPCHKAWSETAPGEKQSGGSEGRHTVLRPTVLGRSALLNQDGTLVGWVHDRGIVSSKALRNNGTARGGGETLLPFTYLIERKAKYLFPLSALLPN